jgi:hypothetical protein
MIDELTAQKYRRNIAPGRLRFVYQLRAESHEAPKPSGRVNYCVKTLDYENAMEGPKHLAQGWQICAQKLRTVQKRVLGKNAVGPLLFDHLPSAFRIPQETREALRSASRPGNRNMRGIQSWHGTFPIKSSGLRQMARARVHVLHYNQHIAA